MKIRCAHCKNVIGDTKKSIDANLNCRKCRKTSHVQIDVLPIPDYLTKKGVDNGKSI